MASISSTGIGSGLDVNSIVSQLVALEKAPLKTLQTKATSVQAQMSAFGQIQSQFSALSDVATRIAAVDSWSARTASSSGTAASITATSAASATSFSLDVDRLAQQQSVSSKAIATGTKLAAGTTTPQTLTIQLGTWSAGGATFATGSASSVTVTVDTADTISAIAKKINGANMGVMATVFNDGTSDRLLLRSQNTGAAAGFRLQSANPALADLVFDPQASPGVGMAAVTVPAIQYGLDAKARINGVAVSSASNTLTGQLAGVTINLLTTTTTGYDPAFPNGTLTEIKAPVTMSIREDVTPAVKNVSDFVAAYNTLNQTLADLTKYDSGTKAAGLFQGDSAVVGLQNVLRNMVGSISLGATSQRLSDVGIERQRDGSLTINTAKLSTAANNGTGLQQLFTNDNSNNLTNGFAVKFRDLSQGVLATGGSVVNKVNSLQSALDRNTQEQTKVNDRATNFEARLRKQYSALDVRMASLNALNSYVAQQVTTWNKSTA